MCLQNTQAESYNNKVSIDTISFKFFQYALSSRIISNLIKNIHKQTTQSKFNTLESQSDLPDQKINKQKENWKTLEIIFGFKPSRAAHVKALPAFPPPCTLEEVVRILSSGFGYPFTVARISTVVIPHPICRQKESYVTTHARMGRVGEIERGEGNERWFGFQEEEERHRMRCWYLCGGMWLTEKKSVH